MSLWTQKVRQIIYVEPEDVRAEETDQLRKISAFEGQWGEVEEAGDGGVLGGGVGWCCRVQQRSL